MIKISVNLPDKFYPICICTDFGSLGESLKEVGICELDKLVIITDTNVNMYQADGCISALEECGYTVYKYIIQAGEQSKTLKTVYEIYSFLVGKELDRSSSILALGGGVVGDIAGFVAATFLRGIKFINLPTSLLAQADSSIGGKVGVDFEGYKNIIGAFYQPRLVYTNVNSLKTLPTREIKSGLAEIIVHGIIKDSELFDYISQNYSKLFSFDQEVLKYIVKVNCSIKGSIVEKDEKDIGLRAILNFGHTIGHAVETASGFRLLHGECVAIGVVAAFKMAHLLNMVTESEVDKVRSLIKKIGLPLKVVGVDANDIFNCVLHDKKIINGNIFFILPKRIGEVVISPIQDYGLIRAVINYVTTTV